MNEHLKPDEIAMLERAEKATKGPWRIVRGSGALVPVHYIEAGTEREPSLIEAWSEDNETFIAAARTDLPTILTRLANERAKLVIAMEALSAVDSQAVCGGMDGPDGDYKMIEHCEEIVTTALRRIEELEK